MSKENEGEFKKRLREELHFCNAIDSSCAEVSPSETKENLYKIFKVLDEARKNLLEGSHFEGDDTDATTAICIDIKKWLKWFGSEENDKK